MACALGIAAIGGGAAGARDTGAIRPSALYRSASAALAPCGADASCAAAATRALLDGIGRTVDRVPTGAAGPSAWLDAAAAWQGVPTERPAVPPRALGDALDDLSRDAGIAVARPRIDAAVAGLTAGARAALADLVGSLVEARRLAAQARVGSGIEAVLADPREAALLVSIVGSSAPGTWPAAAEARVRGILDRVARVDAGMMASAGLILTDAIARFTAADHCEEIDLPLVFMGGDGDTVHEEDRLLLVDCGGNDTYTNNAGGALVGGLVGGSVALDMGSGDDVYVADVGAQGFGAAAPGILYDDGGSDRYELRQFGQGGSVAGVGILYDAGDGDDVYLSPGEDPIATKAASLGGISLLIDEGGSDRYRQDGLDGFDWAAASGIALMVDRGSGDDSYRSDSIAFELLGQEFFNAGPVQVSAEAGGTTIFIDEAGNDTYRCGEVVRQPCQGGGGVWALSLLWDQGGDDAYTMGDTIPDALVLAGQPAFPMGQGAGYAIAVPAGPGIGILYDEAGNDTYTAARWAQGFGSGGAIGILLDDGGGTDSYSVSDTVSGARADGETWVSGILGLGFDR